MVAIAHISTPLWLLYVANPEVVVSCVLQPVPPCPILGTYFILREFRKKAKKKSDRRVNYMRVHRLTRMKFLRHLCSPAWLLVSARGGCLVSAQSGASMGTMVVQFIPGRILRVRSSPGDHGDPVRILRVRFSHGDHGDPARILRV